MSISSTIRTLNESPTASPKLSISNISGDDIILFVEMILPCEEVVVLVFSNLKVAGSYDAGTFT